MLKQQKILPKTFNEFKKKTKPDRNRRWIRIHKQFFTNLLNCKNIKKKSRYSSLKAVFAERFKRTFRDLLKRLVFLEGEGKGIDVLPTITKQYKFRIQSSTILTPILASSKGMKVLFIKVH